MNSFQFLLLIGAYWWVLWSVAWFSPFIAIVLLFLSACLLIGEMPSPPPGETEREVLKTSEVEVMKSRVEADIDETRSRLRAA